MEDDDLDALLEQGILQAELRAEKEKKNATTDSSTKKDRGETRTSNDEKKRSSRRHRSNSSSGSSSGSSQPSDDEPEKDKRKKSSRRRRRHHSRERSSRRSSSRRSRERSSGGGRHRRSSSRDRYRRSRSPRRSRRRSSRSRSRERSSKRRKHRRSRRRSRSSSSSSSSSSSEEEKPRETSQERETKRLAEKKRKEMMELTRDHRTVFVTQLQRKVKEKAILKFFKQLGKVESVLLIRDKFTNRSKGIAYVEMSELDDVPKVLLMNGQVPSFQVFPIMVKASEAEKNFAAKKENEMIAISSSYDDSRTNPAAAAAAARIYVGNLHTNISETDLETVFQSFGDVLRVSINKDESGISKCYGFIQFQSETEANFAISKANGLELAGNYLKLGPVSDAPVEHQPLRSDPSAEKEVFAHADSWKLDDDDGSGMQMNSHSRTALMAKLAGGAAAEIINSNVAPVDLMPTGPSNLSYQDHMAAQLQPQELPPVEGSPSFCFVMKNMFDPSTETEANWDEEIRQDVLSECSKHGPISHCAVETDKPGGLVYVLFSSIPSAQKCVKDMHGRWFNKKQITVRYLSSQEYIGMFTSERAAVLKAREHALTGQ